MQPPLPTCENTLNWAGDQAIHSRQDSSVTRRFPVFRGTTAGPTHRRLHTTTRDPASRLLRHPRGLGCLDPLRMPIRLAGAGRETRQIREVRSTGSEWKAWL